MIIHVDMDAFFASIEQRDFPELRGKPVVVGGSAEARGVVSAASYEARPFGVHSAMPMSQALRRCPGAIVMPGRYHVYQEVSRQIRDIFFSVTPLVEMLSLDEGFLDVKRVPLAGGDAPEIGKILKARIRETTQLVASVGVAPVKFVAKIASEHGKPNGFVVITAEEMLDFLATLHIKRLWGVGPTTRGKLERLGVMTVAQLRNLSKEVLQRQLGSMGPELWNRCRGIDPRPVVPHARPKQLSKETTFARDLTDDVQLRSELHLLTDQVGMRLRSQGYLASGITLKIRFADFRTIARSAKLRMPTDLSQELWNQASEIWEAERVRGMPPVRLLGVSAGGLVEPEQRQLDLFAEDDHEREKKLESATDAIRKRFGNASIKSADFLSMKPRPRHEPNRPVED
ncbi:DNA polymerase IV [Planctomycetes bacterium Pan216]|uniref:DNA polymerase IV n=1 Tax=Kolteria novifilia TaxID=2527975 RepID=UPI0011AA7789